MSTAAYQYQSDDGTLYQVQLPSELASALGYVPATGFETYLPSYLQMRYATFQSVPNSLVLSAPISRPFSAGNPPSNFELTTQIYSQKSLYGETRNANVNQQVQTIAGPQGPGGSAGPTGPTGPTGPAGTGSIFLETTISTWAAGTVFGPYSVGSEVLFSIGVRATCVVANNGYSIGDIIPLSGNANATNSIGVGGWISGGNWGGIIGSGGLYAYNKSAGGFFALTDADWTLTPFAAYVP